MSHEQILTAKPPLFFGEPQDDREFTRKVSLIVRELQDGKLNTIHQITLRPNETTTPVEHSRASVFTVALFSPKSAAAAAAMATIWYTASKSKVELHHEALPDSDRIFGVVLLG
jgi:hypothetical protein